MAEDAAAPALRFALEVTETSGREIFTIALTAQINVDPARRDLRRRRPRPAGRPVRDAGAVAGDDAQLPVGVRDDARAQLCRRHACSLTVPCSYDLELASTKYFTGLQDGEVPLSFHFSGSIVHRGDDGRVQVVLVPWSCSAQWPLPVATWQAMMARLYPNGGYARLHPDTVARLRERQVRRGSPSLDACIAELLDVAPEDAP